MIKINFETYSEFCSNCDDILNDFTMASLFPTFNLKHYRDYVYLDHSFSDNKKTDEMVKDKIWEYLMSYKYDYFNKNDLFSVLGMLKKGK